MKQCTKCKRVLPETEFYFRKDRQTLESHCNECLREYRKEYWKRYKKEYDKDKKSSYDRLYQQKNRDGITKRRRKYGEENKEKKREYDKNHYRKNRERVLECQRRYRQNYADKVREGSRRYYKNHKHKLRRYGHKRQLKKQQLFEDFTIEEWEQKLRKTRGDCPLCGRSYSDVYPFRATMDHTPSISKAPLGFHYTIDNITPMCGSCNSSKSNKGG